MAKRQLMAARRRGGSACTATHAFMSVGPKTHCLGSVCRVPLSGVRQRESEQRPQCVLRASKHCRSNALLRINRDRRLPTRIPTIRRNDDRQEMQLVTSQRRSPQAPGRARRRTYDILAMPSRLVAGRQVLTVVVEPEGPEDLVPHLHISARSYSFIASKCTKKSISNRRHHQRDVLPSQTATASRCEKAKVDSATLGNRDPQRISSSSSRNHYRTADAGDSGCVGLHRSENTHHHQYQVRATGKTVSRLVANQQKKTRFMLRCCVRLA